LTLFVVDGTLDAMPLPDRSADVLVTCRAIGWDLDAELREIERVLERGGAAVHLTGVPDDAWVHGGWHRTLTAAGYVADTYRDADADARRYWRRF
jgi:ubiquinone/menaquinone biosynthesis C-methylase UbiE